MSNLRDRQRVGFTPESGTFDRPISVYALVTMFALLRYPEWDPPLPPRSILEVLATTGSPCPQQTRAGVPGSRVQRADRFVESERTDSMKR